jgi:hypothetical protein
MNMEKDIVVAGGVDKVETYGDLLPQQYYDILAGPRRSNGPRDLMLAVLEDGIRTYVSNITARTTRQRRLFEETKAWIDTRDDRSPFAFETICETFDIDADSLRRRIASLSPQQFRRRVRGPRISTMVTAA